MEIVVKAVFETCILIDFLRGIPSARSELMLCEERIISKITFIETLVGSVTTREEEMIRAFLNTFQVADLDTFVAEKSIEIRKTCRLKVPDAIICATAKVNSCILVTRNTKDFKTEYPNIRIPYVN
jgi:predicted nucleic acid-binding protein